jgi:hypothetical protein
MRHDIFRHDEEYDRLSTSNLLEQLQGKNIITRAHSLAALARRARQDRSLAGAVITAISDPDNKLKRLHRYDLNITYRVCLFMGIWLCRRSGYIT